MFLKLAVVIICAMALPVCSGAQNNPPGPASPDVQEKSLADVARETKVKLKSAKVVVDEDTQGLRRRAGVLPAIPADGIDNSAEIMKAVIAFKKSHTPEETEQMVREWYEDYDAALQGLAADNARIENAAPPRVRTQQEYEVAVELRQMDLQRQKQNGFQMARIQGTFGKVRSLLQKENMNFDWFKIRCGNGNCSF
jgi:hypothetical protein